MIPQNRKYFIIIVHYGRPEPTDALLGALTSSEKQADKIIVVDHGDEAYVPSHKKDNVSVFRPFDNAGYAAGINIGLGAVFNDEISEHDIVICMNNDMEIDTDLIFAVDKWWRRNPAPALMGIKSGRVNLLTGRTVIDTSSLADNKVSRAYIHGSFLSAPYDVFARVQGCPEQYFLYWEDVLISRRVRAKGIPLKIGKLASVRHDDELREKYSDNQTYYLVRNGALFLEKETPIGWRQLWWLLNRLRFIWHRHLRSRSNKVAAEALADAISGVTGKRKVV